MARVAVRVAMTGDKEMLKKLRTIASESTDKGLRKEARAATLDYGNQTILPKVQGRTPIKRGRLVRSERIRVLVSPKKGELRVAVCAGGPFATYAMKVHEDLEAEHKVGRAKFIESVIFEEAPTAAAAIAPKIDLKRAAG